MISAAALMTAGYAQTFGRESTLRTVVPLSESPAVGQPGIEPEVRCIFPVVRVWPFGGRRGPSELYYLDPTGTRVLYKANERPD